MAQRPVGSACHRSRRSGSFCPRCCAQCHRVYVVEVQHHRTMRNAFLAAAAALALAPAAQAQMINCWNGSCYGPGVNTHTYNGQTTGTINGQSVNTHTYNGQTTGTLGGQSVNL